MVFNLENSFGTDDPKLVFLVRLLGMVILLKFYLHSFQIAIPFIPFYDLIFFEDEIQKTVRGMAIVGGVLLLLSYQIRIGLGLAIFAVGLTILSSMTNYSDSRVFVFYVLIIASIATFRAVQVTTLIRIQLIIMYLGSALNKGWSEGWLNGDYMNFWLFSKLNLNHSVLEFLPAFPVYLGWAVIGVEVLIPLLLLFRSTTGLAVGLGLCMHGCSILVVGHTFGVFIPLLCICFSLLLDWPEKVIIFVSKNWNQQLRKYTRITSLFNSIELQINERIGFQLRNRSFHGMYSLVILISILPLFHAAFVIIILIPTVGPYLKGLLVIFFAVLWFYSDRVLQNTREALE